LVSIGRSVDSTYCVNPASARVRLADESSISVRGYWMNRTHDAATGLAP